jgi:hypothetical protein
MQPTSARRLERRNDSTRRDFGLLHWPQLGQNEQQARDQRSLPKIAHANARPSLRHRPQNARAALRPSQRLACRLVYSKRAKAVVDGQQIVVDEEGKGSGGLVSWLFSSEASRRLGVLRFETWVIKIEISRLLAIKSALNVLFDRVLCWWIRPSLTSSHPCYQMPKKDATFLPKKANFLVHPNAISRLFGRSRYFLRSLKKTVHLNARFSFSKETNPRRLRHPKRA